MSLEPNYIFRRFGPVVAKRVFGALCIVFFLYLVALLGLVVRYMILGDDASLAALGWVAAALSCLGMAVLWQMYKSGVASLARSGRW
jgi:hypothetical protein